MTERERLIDLLDSADTCYMQKSNPEPRYFSAFVADYLLANGVTIPVRCKECKRCDIKEYGKSGKWCKLTTLPLLQRDHYCSYGERRSDNG